MGCSDDDESHRMDIAAQNIPQTLTDVKFRQNKRKIATKEKITDVSRKKCKMIEKCKDATKTKTRRSFSSKEKDIVKRKNARRAFWGKMLKSFPMLPIPIVTRSMTRQYDEWKDCLQMCNEDRLMKMTGSFQFPFWCYGSKIITRSFTKGLDMEPYRIACLSEATKNTSPHTSMVDRPSQEMRNVAFLQQEKDSTELAEVESSNENEFHSVISKDRRRHLKSQVLNYMSQNSSDWWSSGDAAGLNSVAQTSNNMEVNSRTKKMTGSETRGINKAEPVSSDSRDFQQNSDACSTDFSNKTNASVQVNMMPSEFQNSQREGSQSYTLDSDVYLISESANLPEEPPSFYETDLTPCDHSGQRETTEEPVTYAQKEHLSHAIEPVSKFNACSNQRIPRILRSTGFKFRTQDQVQSAYAGYQTPKNPQFQIGARVPAAKLDDSASKSSEEHSEIYRVVESFFRSTERGDNPLQNGTQVLTAENLETVQTPNDKLWPSRIFSPMPMQKPWKECSPDSRTLECAKPETVGILGPNVLFPEFSTPEKFNVHQSRASGNRIPNPLGGKESTPTKRKIRINQKTAEKQRLSEEPGCLFCNQNSLHFCCCGLKIRSGLRPTADKVYAVNSNEYAPKTMNMIPARKTLASAFLPIVDQWSRSPVLSLGYVYQSVMNMISY